MCDLYFYKVFMNLFVIYFIYVYEVYKDLIRYGFNLDVD